MKNLKTIIGTLVLTVFLFGCQTNDETTELQLLSEVEVGENTNSNQNQGRNETISILIQYNDDVSESYKQGVRDEFSSFFTFINIVPCQPNKERWVITLISEEEFSEALEELGYKIRDTNTLDANGDDEVTGNQMIALRIMFFNIMYDVDCSYVFPTN